MKSGNPAHGTVGLRPSVLVDTAASCFMAARDPPLAAAAFMAARTGTFMASTGGIPRYARVGEAC